MNIVYQIFSCIIMAWGYGSCSQFSMQQAAMQPSQAKGYTFFDPNPVLLQQVNQAKEYAFFDPKSVPLQQVNQAKEYAFFDPKSVPLQQVNQAKGYGYAFFDPKSVPLQQVNQAKEYAFFDPKSVPLQQVNQAKGYTFFDPNPVLLQQVNQAKEYAFFDPKSVPLQQVNQAKGYAFFDPKSVPLQQVNQAKGYGYAFFDPKSVPLQQVNQAKGYAFFDPKPVLIQQNKMPSYAVSNFDFVRPGLNLQGPCMNPDCASFQLDICSPRGFYTRRVGSTTAIDYCFNIGYEYLRTACPLCQHPLYQPDVCVLVDCKYSYYGISHAGKEKQGNGVISGFEAVFDLRTWHALRVAVSPITIPKFSPNLVCSTPKTSSSKPKLEAIPTQPLTPSPTTFPMHTRCPTPTSQKETYVPHSTQS